jgi:hypothetical protein
MKKYPATVANRKIQPIAIGINPDFSSINLCTPSKIKVRENREGRIRVMYSKDGSLVDDKFIIEVRSVRWDFLIIEV